MSTLIKAPFGAISDRLFQYLCSLYQQDEPLPYPLQRGQKGSLFGTVFSVYVAHMLGRVSELPGVERISDTILALRNEQTGLFFNPDIKVEDFLKPKQHSELYVTLQTTSFCYSCLNALDVDVDSTVQWLNPLLVDGNLSKWLDGLDWDNPWLVSNLDMFLGIFLLNWNRFYPENKIVDNAVKEYFSWHDDKQDGGTGFWGGQEDLFCAMAGAYHIFIHYDYLKRPIQYLDRVIDSTLSLVSRDGLFVYGGGGGSCEDMDAVDILIRCSLLTDYRSSDVRKILLDAARMLASGQQLDGGFSWRVQPKFFDCVNVFNGYAFLNRKMYNFLYKLRSRSHYVSVHNYSSLKVYPFKLHKSDTWSSWFRPLALSYIARRYPDHFEESCDWHSPSWPGLGFDPFF